MPIANPHVLIVDDELFFREAVSDILQEAGIQTDSASVGLEGLRKAENTNIGVVILDINMPGMDGMQVLERLRIMRPELKVIMLSAESDQSYILEALKKGASDYLAKPIHEEELTLAVQRSMKSYAVAAAYRDLELKVPLLEHHLSVISRLNMTADNPEWRTLIGRAVTEAVSEVLAAGKSTLRLVSDDSLDVVGVAGVRLSAVDYESISVQDPVEGEVFQSGDTLFLANLREDERFQDPDRKARYREPCVIAVPVASRGLISGVLSASGRVGGGAFGSVEVAMIKIIANRVGQVVGDLLDAEALHDEGKERKGNYDETIEISPDQLDATTAREKLALLLDQDGELARRICEAMTLEVEPSRILESVLHPVAECLHAEPVSIYLVNEGTGLLVLEGQAGDRDRGDRPMLPVGRGLTGVVFQTGQPILSDYPEGDSRFDAEVNTAEDGEVNPLVCLPLRFRGKTLGIFRGFLRGGMSVSPRTAEILSSALSVSIRNVQLYRSLVDSIEEVALIRREMRESELL